MTPPCGNERQRGDGLIGRGTPNISAPDCPSPHRISHPEEVRVRAANGGVPPPVKTTGSLRQELRLDAAKCPCRPFWPRRPLSAGLQPASGGQPEVFRLGRRRRRRTELRQFLARRLLRRLASRGDTELAEDARDVP